MPAITQEANLVHYTWTMDKIDATQYDTNTPAWYNSSKVFMISDFDSWQAVGQWGQGLFRTSDSDAETIKREVAPSFEAVDEADYVLKVIRFVQDEVRYLRMEMGEGSHRPNNPNKVFAQRFGDCKDKSY